MEEIKYSLRELRARKGVTQEAVANHLGIARITYSKWEKDPGQIMVSKIYELADYFNVNVEEIKIK